jgi:hypothetical protein
MTGESDIAYLARLPGCQCRLQCASRGEDAVGVLHANDLVELHQIDGVHFEPAQRLLQLLLIGLLGAAVDLGHQQDFITIAILQRVAHARFAVAIVIVPAVVQKVDSAIDGGANKAHAVRGVGLHADVIAAHTDGGDLFSGTAQLAILHL